MTPITVNLPKQNQTGKAEYADVEDNDVALKEGIEKAGEEIDAISGFTWYTPKVIATEESRTNTSFGTLTTADEITNVVVPENGLVVLGYTAAVKSSVEAAGFATFRVNGVSITTPQGLAEKSEARTIGTGFTAFGSCPSGLTNIGEGSAFSGAYLTLGGINASSAVSGGLCILHRVAAGTYTITVQYRATSGSITAKNRALYVATLG